MHFHFHGDMVRQIVKYIFKNRHSASYLEIKLTELHQSKLQKKTLV